MDWKTVVDAGLSLNWLEYSFKRSLGIESADAEEQQMGTEQVFGAIDYLNNYDGSLNEVIGWLFGSG